jgi:hypothetical protein
MAGLLLVESFKNQSDKDEHSLTQIRKSMNQIPKLEPPPLFFAFFPFLSVLLKCRISE